MRAVHGLSLTFLLGLGALGGAVLLSAGPRGSEDSTRPDQGALSPLPARLPEPQPVARIGGGSGSVQDLAASQGALAILSSKEWFLLAGDSLCGGFGDPAPGSPDWLARPVSIALGEGRVYVLDAGRRALTVWDTRGVRLEDVPLIAAAEDLSVQPFQVVVDGRGDPVVLAFHLARAGTGRWEARSYGKDQPGRLILTLPGSSPSALFERPFLAPHRGALLGMNALDQSVFRVEEGGAGPVPLLDRRDPPLWYIPRRFRNRYAGLLGGLGGGSTASVSALPQFWPSVRDVTVRPDGSFLVAVPAGEERQHVELVGSDGRALLRFNLDGFLEPVFLDGGRAFLVRETLDETVIHELLPPRD